MTRQYYNRIQQLRKQHKLSLEYLELLTGIDQETLKKLESCELIMTRHESRLIATALGVNEEKLSNLYEVYYW